MIEHIIVSEASIKANDLPSLVQSNVNVIDAMLNNFILREELAPAALQSYHVNLYETCMLRGGFAEFVVVCSWEQTCIESLVEGLERVQAPGHIELLGKFSQRLMTHGADGIACLYDREHPQNQQMRSFLNESMPEFEHLNLTENLAKLNGQWLKNHPKLVVMTQAGIEKQIETSSRAIPDRLRRIARSLDQEPRYMKLIRLLCDVANLDFLRLITKQTSQSVFGTTLNQWQFDAVQGAFYLTDENNEAAIFSLRDKVEVARVKTEDVELSNPV